MGIGSWKLSYCKNERSHTDIETWECVLPVGKFRLFNLAGVENVRQRRGKPWGRGRVGITCEDPEYHKTFGFYAEDDGKPLWLSTVRGICSVYTTTCSVCTLLIILSIL